MSDRPNYSEDQMDAFFKKVNSPLEKTKEALWEEVFEEKVTPTIQSPSKPHMLPSRVRRVWKLSYRMAAIVTLVVSLTVVVKFISNSEKVAETPDGITVADETTLSNDSALVESLFIEDQDVDAYLSAYVINQIVKE